MRSKCLLMKTSETGGNLLKPNQATDVSLFQTFVIVSNLYIGNASWQGGKNLDSGLLFSLIVNVIFAVICFYSSWIMQTAAGTFHATSYDEIWRKQNLKGGWFLQLAIVIPSVGFTSYYIQLNSALIKDLVTSLSPTASEYYSDAYLVCLGMLVILLPFFVQTDNRINAIGSWISHIVYLITIIINIIMMIQGFIDHGFDPANQIRMFDFNSNWLQMVSERIVTWTNFNINFPSFIKMENYTPDNAKKICLWSLVVALVFMQLSQYITYFILYNDQTTLLYFDLPKNTMVSIALVCAVLKLTLMIPCFLYASAQSLYDLSSSGSEIVVDKGRWFALCMLLYIASALLSTTDGVDKTIFMAFQNCFSMVMQYLVPAIIFIQVVKKNPALKTHWPAVILLFVLGVGLAAYTLISFAFSF